MTVFATPGTVAALPRQRSWRIEYTAAAGELHRALVASLGGRADVVQTTGLTRLVVAGELVRAITQEARRYLSPSDVVVGSEALSVWVSPERLTGQVYVRGQLVLRFVVEPVTGGAR